MSTRALAMVAVACAGLAFAATVAIVGGRRSPSAPVAVRGDQAAGPPAGLSGGDDPDRRRGGRPPSPLPAERLAAEIRIPALTEFDRLVMHERSSNQLALIDEARSQIMRGLGDIVRRAIVFCAPKTRDPLRVRTAYRLELLPAGTAIAHALLSFEVERGAPLGAAAEACVTQQVEQRLPFRIELAFHGAGTLPAFDGSFSLMSEQNTDGQCGAL